MQRNQLVLNVWSDVETEKKMTEMKNYSLNVCYYTADENTLKTLKK